MIKCEIEAQGYCDGYGDIDGECIAFDIPHPSFSLYGFVDEINRIHEEHLMNPLPYLQELFDNIGLDKDPLFLEPLWREMGIYSLHAFYTEEVLIDIPTVVYDTPKLSYISLGEGYDEYYGKGNYLILSVKTVSEDRVYTSDFEVAGSPKTYTVRGYMIEEDRVFKPDIEKYPSLEEKPLGINRRYVTKSSYEYILK